MHFYDSLTPDVLDILRNKHTERPFSGPELAEDHQKGTFVCVGCGQALFRGQSAFASGCGWPSFDDQLPGAVEEVADADGLRTEIVCSCCQGHLGHVFYSEGFTRKNKRHCVNSKAIAFVKSSSLKKIDEAIVAGGCFWGVEYYFAKLEGVVRTEVGYIGGQLSYPSYEAVCSHLTGHVEAVKIFFDPQIIDYKKIITYFFEIHNPEQPDGQGPDLGSSYLSRIFYFNEAQKKIAQERMDVLKDMGYQVATKLQSMKTFWPAEAYHQQYYDHRGKLPYCHRQVKRFEKK